MANKPAIICTERERRVRKWRRGKEEILIKRKKEKAAILFFSWFLVLVVDLGFGCLGNFSL